MAFTTEMDIHEVYKFVNLFPFLIDPTALEKLMDEDSAANRHYILNEESIAKSLDQSLSSGSDSLG